MDHKQMNTPRGPVHYWTAGTGSETILFTHGATADHAMFDKQMEAFASQYRVISWDAPAHGLSRPYTGFTVQQAADDLIQLMDTEGIRRAHLVGQSMGGYIEQVVASDHPERVQSLTAVDSAPIQRRYMTDLDRWLVSISTPLMKLYPYNTLVTSMADQVSTTPEGKAYMLRVLKTLSKDEIVHILDVAFNDTIKFDRGNFACPIFIICGDKDRSGKVLQYSRRWAELEKHPYAEIANAGHNSNVDAPEEFNRLLDGFLKSVK